MSPLLPPGLKRLLRTTDALMRAAVVLFICGLVALLGWFDSAFGRRKALMVTGAERQKAEDVVP